MMAAINAKSPSRYFSGRGAFLDMGSVCGIVDNTECYKHRKQNIQQAVDGCGNVDAYEFLYAEHNECGKGEP
jgi:hypothetical protein